MGAVDDESAIDITSKCVHVEEELCIVASTGSSVNCSAYSNDIGTVDITSEGSRIPEVLAPAPTRSLIVCSCGEWNRTTVQIANQSDWIPRVFSDASTGCGGSSWSCRIGDS